MEAEYYKNKESVQEYINMAKDVSGLALIEKFEKFLAHDAVLLEIGSGPGTDWRILNKSHRTIGSDNSTTFLEHLKAKNPSGRFMELDAVTLKTNEKFDGIYSNKVMHHLTDDELKASVKRQSEILNPKGIICHSFWKGEGTEVFKGLFVNYHSENELRQIYEDYFELFLIESYKEFDDGDSILLIGQRK